jgi:hypothetical protein
MEAYSVSEATLTLSRVSATDILYRPLQFQVHIKLYPSSGPYSRTKPVDSHSSVWLSRERASIPVCPLHLRRGQHPNSENWIRNVRRDVGSGM